MGVSKRTRQRELKKNVATVLIIAVFAVAVFSINSIGRFIADKIITPLADFSGINGEKVSTNSISTEKLEFYLINGGTYSTADEAQGFVKDKGGYVFRYDGSFNAILAVYNNKEEATAFAEEGGYSLITLTLDKLKIKVTGKSDQVKALNDSFSLLSTTAETLCALTLQVSAGEISFLQCASRLNAIEDKRAASEEALKSLNSENSTVKALLDMLSLNKALLDEAPASDDETFCKRLNYITCAYVTEYFKFYSELE